MILRYLSRRKNLRTLKAIDRQLQGAKYAVTLMVDYRRGKVNVALSRSGTTYTYQVDSYYHDNLVRIIDARTH